MNKWTAYPNGDNPQIDGYNIEAEDHDVGLIFKEGDAKLAVAAAYLLAAIEDLLQSLAELGCYPGSDEDVSGADVVELLHTHFSELHAVVEEAGGEVPKPLTRA